MKYYEDYIDQDVAEIQEDEEIKYCAGAHASINEDVVSVTEKILPVVTISNNEPIYIGTFKLTAYCPCKECCGKTDGITASGTIATQGRTIAVDPSIIPYGTVLVINGHEYIAEDCGGKWIIGKEIDIFFDSHEEEKEFGVQYAEAFIYARE